ncbi:MAG: SCO family protein [Anaerolineales bacterium]|jgi:protein SCO1/2
MVKRSLVIGGVILVVAIGLGIFLGFLQEYAFNGVVYENPKPAPQIILDGSDDAQFNLKSLSDKIVLIFFGYTSCPDVCPSTLSDMKRVTKLLGDDADSVQVIFITVDPDRDTVEKLNSYLSLFDPKFLGLTGAVSDLEKVWDEYGVYREVDTSSKTAAGYLVNHSSRLYLIDQKGRLFLTYGYGTSPESIAEDIEYLISN